MTAATLYIVPTPIGNLEDLSPRAVKILQQVNYIACEDTRHSNKLLQHFHIITKTTSLHEYNESNKQSWLIEQLNKGNSIALISDAGTPLISDPGYHLVNKVRDAGFCVIPLPGPCAAITALSASGLPTNSFIFEGFLPSKPKARADKLQSLITQTSTIIFYESPHRIMHSLESIKDIFGSRSMVLARELTKTFETFITGTAEEIIKILEQDPNQQKGEMVLICKGASSERPEITSDAIRTLKLLNDELPLTKACSLTAKIYNLKKSELYNYALEQNLT